MVPTRLGWPPFRLDSLPHCWCPCCRVWTVFKCPPPLPTNGESLLRGESWNHFGRTCSNQIHTAQTVTHTTVHHTLPSSPSDPNHYQVVISWQLSPSLHPGHNTSSLMRQLQSQSLIFGPKCSASAKSTHLRVGQSGAADLVSMDISGTVWFLVHTLARHLVSISAFSDHFWSRVQRTVFVAAVTLRRNSSAGLALQPRLNPAFCTLNSSHLLFGLL